MKSAKARPASTILAFDYGRKHIGVAIGDTETRMAHALGVVEGASSAARMAGIEFLVGEWRPDRLVVGLPLALDGTEHKMTVRARRFARQRHDMIDVRCDDIGEWRLASGPLSDG